MSYKLFVPQTSADTRAGRQRRAALAEPDRAAIASLHRHRWATPAEAVNALASGWALRDVDFYWLLAASNRPYRVVAGIRRATTVMSNITTAIHSRRWLALGVCGLEEATLAPYHASASGDDAPPLALAFTIQPSLARPGRVIDTGRVAAQLLAMQMGSGVPVSQYRLTPEICAAFGVTPPMTNGGSAEIASSRAACAVALAGAIAERCNTGWVFSSVIDPSGVDRVVSSD